jgi:hypothetical protein
MDNPAQIIPCEKVHAISHIVKQETEDGSQETGEKIIVAAVLRLFILTYDF